MRKSRSDGSHRFVAVVIGVALSFMLSALMAAGALDCARTDPGTRCAMAQLAFGDGSLGTIRALLQKSQ
jgi:hypothetical protein